MHKVGKDTKGILLYLYYGSGINSIHKRYPNYSKRRIKKMHKCSREHSRWLSLLRQSNIRGFTNTKDAYTKTLLNWNKTKLQHSWVIEQDFSELEKRVAGAMALHNDNLK